MASTLVRSARAFRSYWCKTWFFIDILESGNESDEEDESEEQEGLEKEQSEKGKPETELPEEDGREQDESEGLESEDAGSEEAEARALNEEKKAAVYAKVQELRDEDVAHITRMHMPCTKASAHVLGDPKDDMWSYWVPSPDTERRAVYFYVPMEKRDALRAANLDIPWFKGHKRRMQIMIKHWPWEDVVREVIERSGLTKDELLTVIGLECGNESLDLWVL